jgi:energy-coupling factor transport system ATP-binding protein
MAPPVELIDAVFCYPGGGFSVRCKKLVLNKGELTFITGANGSGKTTLSKMLCGILPLSQGALLINGTNAKGKSLGFIGKTVGYLFQSPEKQLFATSVIEELTFVPLLLGKEEHEVINKAEELLNTFGMGHLRDRSPFRLSRGEKQRLAICAVLMQGPAELILDEPTSGLDRENRKVLHTVIDTLLGKGVGVSVITHDNELLSRFSAQMVLVESGVVRV